MRNLKRVLSLSLASIMLLGMMVIGSSAASNYTDVDYDEDNVEAIEVLQAVNVMSGDLDNDGNLAGTFRPGDEVKRSEMARIMAFLMDLDYDYYIGVNPFADMVGHWAEKYAAACAANGIIYGRGDGIYDPDKTVTAVEAASMLMRALGYFQNPAVDQPNGFEIDTIRQAGRINLFNKVDAKTNEPMTRNDVAQLVLNALQSGMVEPSTSSKIDVTVGDAQVTIGSSNYVYVVSRDLAVGNAINTDRADSGNGADGLEGPILDLGEKLYNGKLRLYKYSDDEFMRPSRTWEFDGKEIGTYMKTENVRETYTQAVSNRTLYDLLGRNALEEYVVTYYVNGVPTDNDITIDNDPANTILSRTTNDFGMTGNGVLTQIFMDVEKGTIDITSINTYLAQATANYNSSTQSVTLDVFSRYVQPNTQHQSKTVSLIDVPGIETIEQDDFVRICLSGKNATGSTSLYSLTGYDVVAVEDVETLTDVALTKFSKGSSSTVNSDTTIAIFKSVVADGTEYKSSNKASYNEDVLDLYDNGLLADHTYTIYLDRYGYALGIELYSGNDNYVFITGFDPGNSNIALGSAKAAAIFTDGTMRTINVNVRDTNKNIDRINTKGEVGNEYFERWSSNMLGYTTSSLNRWYTYTVDAAGEYTLNPAVRMFTTEDVDATGQNPTLIRSDNVRIDENPADVLENTSVLNATRDYKGADSRRAYGNDDSIYIIVEAEEPADATGGDNVISDVTGVYTGVQSVEIEVTGKTAASDEVVGTLGTNDRELIANTVLYDSIYTLYDRNNYIIASVILGEARGGDASYAYILSAAKDEELLPDGTTQWTFDAVVDGEIVALTTNTKFGNVISKLEPGHIQELRYNGDAWWWGSTAIAGQTAVTNGHLTADIANDIRMDGNTLRLTDITKGAAATHKYGADAGLAIVPGAPAVVLQWVGNKWTKQGYNSVSQALGEIYDADPTTTDRKEFEGRIVGALDSTGRAKWLVFISDTPVPVAAGGVNTSTTTLDGDASVEEVQALLDRGRNVTIRNSWVPRDTYPGSMTALDLNGQTLTINGAFNAGTTATGVTTGTRVTITGTGNLVVKGAFQTCDTVSDVVNYSITANSINLATNNGPVVFHGNVTTTNGNLLLGGAAQDVTFNGTTTIAENLASSAGPRTVNVNGTMNAKNVTNSGGGLTVNVTTVSSLDVTGTVGSGVTVDVGASGTADGYAKIGTLASGAELKVDNLSGLSTKPSVVIYAKQNSTLTIDSGILMVEKELGTDDFTIADGQKMTFGASAKAVDDAIGLFVDEAGVPTNNLGNGEIIGASGAGTGGKTDAPITVTNVTGGSDLVSDEGVISSDASISQIEQALQSDASGDGEGLTIEDLDTDDGELEIPAGTSLTVTGTAAGTIEGDGAIVFGDDAGVKAGEELDLSEIDDVTFGEEFNVPDNSKLVLPDETLTSLPTITGNGEVDIGGGSADEKYAEKLGKTVDDIPDAVADDDNPPATTLPKAPKIIGGDALTEYGTTTIADMLSTYNNGADSLSIYTIKLTPEQAPNESKITLEKSFNGRDYAVMNGGGENEPESWNEATVKAEYRNIVLFVASTVHSIKITIEITGEGEGTYTYILTNPNFSGTVATD